jgi:hypothetical protein
LLFVVDVGVAFLTLSLDTKGSGCRN